MTDTRDHPPGGTRGSHLAHWPPPLRGHEVKPVLPKHHQAGEPAQHEKPRGWGLTRSVFKDDADE